MASFIVLGNLLKRTKPEYLKVVFPQLNLGFGKSGSVGECNVIVSLSVLDLFAQMAAGFSRMSASKFNTVK